MARSAWGRKSILLVLVVLPLAVFLDIGWEVVAAQRANVNAVPWEIQSEAMPVQRANTAADAESLLREAHQHLTNGQRAQALRVAQEMVIRYPHFQLGQLLYADLLNLVSENPIDARSVLDYGTTDATLRLRQLNDEARLRLNRPEAQVYEGKEPAGLIYLSPQVPYVIVVDASKSRLYVLANKTEQETPASKSELKLVFESYLSVGQRGIGKQQRGDGRTPLGTYVIQKSYPGHALPDLYGSGALTLNYPNDLDIQDGKTGSGIWIHGSPSEQYARAPESTDGCVVVSNPDMQTLMKLQLPAGTPVFIQPKIDWVEPLKNKHLRAQWWPSELDGGAQSPREVLALLSWSGEGRKMMAALYANENAGAKQAKTMAPRYWIERANKWEAVAVN
ncbi:MAG: L,D-transpeptidase family protein [Limnohabitans sp.]